MRKLVRSDAYDIVTSVNWLRTNMKEFSIARCLIQDLLNLTIYIEHKSQHTYTVPGGVIRSFFLVPLLLTDTRSVRLHLLKLGKVRYLVIRSYFSGGYYSTCWWGVVIQVPWRKRTMSGASSIWHFGYGREVNYSEVGRIWRRTRMCIFIITIFIWCLYSSSQNPGYK